MTSKQQTMTKHGSLQRRELGVQTFQISLFLDLQYLNEDFETMDPADIKYFCDSCVSQLSSPIVRAAAAAYNATIIGAGVNGADGLNCAVRTVKVYDPEAEDLFGAGYFSLQVHASFSIVLESSNLLWLELVQSITSIGFERISGGADDLLLSLQANEAFESKSTPLKKRKCLFVCTNRSPGPVLRSRY